MPDSFEPTNPYPENLPLYQQANPRHISFLGRTHPQPESGKPRVIFGIKRSDRMRHMFIIGKSGVGKSKLIESLVRQDISFEQGLCYIDAQGDHIPEILDFIFEQRIHDVMVIDPTDEQSPVLFNPCAGVREENSYQYTERLIEIFKEIADSWNQQQEYLLRMTIRAILNYPHATLAGLAAILTDEGYRVKVLEHIKNESVHAFFKNEFPQWKEKFYADGFMPVINTLSGILTNPYLKKIFSREENKVDFDTCIAERKIVLVSLARKTLGEKNSAFLGSLILKKILHAGIQQSIYTENQNDFYIYLDSMLPSIPHIITDLLVEGKKYKLALTIAVQSAALFTPQTLSLLLSSIGTLISFEVNGEDAARLEKEMQPRFKARDLVNMENQCFAIKMSIDGKTENPFLAQTLKILRPPHDSKREKITAYSRETYGT